MHENLGPEKAHCFPPIIYGAHKLLKKIFGTYFVATKLHSPKFILQKFDMKSTIEEDMRDKDSEHSLGGLTDKFQNKHSCTKKNILVCQGASSLLPLGYFLVLAAS